MTDSLILTALMLLPSVPAGMFAYYLGYKEGGRTVLKDFQRIFKFHAQTKSYKNTELEEDS